MAFRFGYPHPRLMLNDMTSTEVTEMLAYAWIESGGFQKEIDKDERTMANNLRKGFEDRGLIKHG